MKQTRVGMKGNEFRVWSVDAALIKGARPNSHSWMNRRKAPTQSYACQVSAD